jgi:predicted RNase H-like HicB family nuclease
MPLIELMPEGMREGESMTKRFTAVITKEEKWYVAHCVELGVVSQGKTIEKAQANLKEAVELYLESFGTEDLPESKGEIVLYPLEVAVGG